MKALVLALAIVLAGCAHEQPREDKAPAAPELTFYTSLGQAEWEVLRRVVFPPFEQANGCTVRAIEVASSDMARKLDALRQGGQLDVDVIGQDNMSLSLLVQQGLMVDLSGFQLPAQTLPALLPVGVFGGKRYFVPYRPNVEITYYNAAYFGRAGLQPPKTWPALLSVARTFHERDGVGRVAIKADGTAGATAQLLDFINAAGGDPLKLDDEGCATAFTFLRELWPVLSPESRRADFNTMNQFLAMESVYLGQNWPFGIEVVVRQGEKADVKAYSGWRGPVREAHTLGGEVLGIPAGAPHRELAAKFIAHLQGREVQRELVRELAWPPMRTDAYAEVAGWQKPYFAAVRQALGTAIARPNVPYWEAFDKAINAAFRDIVVEGADLRPTLRRYAADLAAAKARATDEPIKGR